jgi:hypothetical protein
MPSVKNLHVVVDCSNSCYPDLTDKVVNSLRSRLEDGYDFTVHFAGKTAWTKPAREATQPDGGGLWAEDVVGDPSSKVLEEVAHSIPSDACVLGISDLARAWPKFAERQENLVCDGKPSLTPIKGEHHAARANGLRCGTHAVKSIDDSIAALFKELGRVRRKVDPMEF